jgi:hypothetical protein
MSYQTWDYYDAYGFTNPMGPFELPMWGVIFFAHDRLRATGARYVTIVDLETKKVAAHVMRKGDTIETVEGAPDL